MGHPNVYKCRICNNYFDTPNAIDQHFQQQHPTVPKRANAWKCTVCAAGKYFDTCQDLQKHIDDGHI
jgi:hypothetical protein